MSVKTILGDKVALEERFISDYDELSRVIQVLRDCGHRISMTQGVYDLIHPGHTRYLEKAKEAGDILVVAVDTDEYTRQRKQKRNERRPAIPFEERLEILANLRTVDILTLRDLKEHEDDKDFVIKVVKPDVLVMSESTSDVNAEKHEELREILATHGGELLLLKPQATVSTTARLRELLIDGAGELAGELMAVIERYFQKAGRKLDLGGKEEEESGS